MAAWTPLDRLRAYVKRWARGKPRGWKTQLARDTGIPKQNISYFLNNTKGRDGIGIRDLDVMIAALQASSIGEMFLEPRRKSDLAPVEMRLVLAFRALSPSTKIHVTAILEEASIAARLIDQQHGNLTAEADLDTDFLPEPDIKLVKSVKALGEGHAKAASSMPIGPASSQPPMTSTTQDSHDGVNASLRAAAAADDLDVQTTRQTYADLASLEAILKPIENRLSALLDAAARARSVAEDHGSGSKAGA